MPDCNIFKLNSVQVMAFWSVIGGVIVAGAPIFLWYLNMLIAPLPFWLRAIVGGLISGVTLGSYLYARLRPQPKVTGK